MLGEQLLVVRLPALSTLPAQRQDRLVRRSRPCLAEPPADSPSTMNSSLSPGSVELQSRALPGI